MNPVADARRGPVTLGLMMAQVMTVLDTTVVNVALPHMQGNLSASPEQITWVVTSYIIATAVVTPISGWLAARLGLKPLLLLAIAGFTVASMLCGIAADLPEMVAFRMLQGMTAAPIGPLCQAALFNVTPPQHHSRAMALFMVGTVVAPVVGPIVGGYLTEELSWRWCFYINLPAGFGAMLLLWTFLPREETAKARRFDFLGFGSLAVAIASLQLMLDRGPSLDWFGSREIWIEATLAAGGFWVFLVHTLTARHPLFHPSLARDRNYVTATALTFFINMLLFTGVTLLPLMMQGILGYSVVLSGLVSVPRGIAMMIVLLVMGRVDTLVDRRLLVALGLCTCVVGFSMMTRFDLSMDSNQIIWAGLVQGIGQGIVFVPLTTLQFTTVDPALRAEASGVSSLMRNLGSSTGVAMMQAITMFNGQRMHASLAEHVTATNPVLRSALSSAAAPDTAQGALALNAEITRQAMMVAYVDDFRIMVLLGLLCVPLVLLIRPPRRKAAPLVEVHAA